MPTPQCHAGRVKIVCRKTPRRAAATRPILPDEPEVDRAADHGGERAVICELGDHEQLAIAEIPDARREAVAEEVDFTATFINPARTAWLMPVR
jgi:hypothetical protein